MNPKTISRYFLPIMLLSSLLGTATLALAQTPTVNWVQWTSPGSFPNSAADGYGGGFIYASGTTGSLQPLGGGSDITITIAGEVIQDPTYQGYGSDFTTSAVNSIWSQSYTSNPPGMQTPSVFLSSNVPTLPSNGSYIGISGLGIQSQTISFSTPVQNLIMNIWSLGGGPNTATWIFNQPFLLLSGGSNS